MKPLVLALCLILAASCAGSPQTPEVRHLVPLIKSGRFDELAADPDHIAPAVVAALREMRSEGADPKRIVAVGDFFFDNYPFCARDLVIDESTCESVAAFHFEAATRLIPALESCAELEKAPTLIGKLAVLEKEMPPHADGGRCARHVRDILLELCKRGPEWWTATDLIGRGPPYDVSLGNDLASAAFDLFGNEPWWLLVAFAGERLSLSNSFWRWDAWETSRLEEPHRWGRMYRTRLAWLAALRFEPYFHSVYRWSDVLKSSRFDSRLPELGAALEIWGKAAGDCEFSQEHPPDFDALKRGVAAVVRHGEGTPFPDVARYSHLTALAQMGKLEEAEALARELKGLMSHPFFASHGLLQLAEIRREDDQRYSPDEAVRLAKLILSWDPLGYSASSAWVLIGRIHEGAGRDDEAEDCWKAALNVPLPTGPYEDDDPYFARSEAGVKLARHLQKRREWRPALEVWKSWESYSWCATCSWGQDEDKNLGIAQCLEALGQVNESAEYYWNAAMGQGPEAVDVAKTLKEIHRKLGSLSELTERVRKSVKQTRSYDNKVEFGLKWLAEDLGVPIE